MSAARIEEAKPPLEHGLRPTTPDAILDFLETNWKPSIRVDMAGQDKQIQIPEGWHGAGKEGDTFVSFGKLLTEPIAQTELSTASLIDWMDSNGFTFESGHTRISPGEAILLLNSDKFPQKKSPLVRMVSTSDVPIIIEIAAGALSEPVQTISKYGNKALKEALQADERDAYIAQFKSLYADFVTVDIAATRDRMGLPSHMNTQRRIDDVIASDVTFAGHKIVERYNNNSRLRNIPPVFEIDEAAIITTQAIMIEIFMAQRNKNPLLLRGGVIANGLAGKDKGINYIHNTDTGMLATHGPMVCADVGEIFDPTGEAKVISPLIVNHPRGVGEVTLFLGGGLKVGQLLMEIYDENSITRPQDMTYVRASRVDSGLSEGQELPDEWGVLFTWFKIL